MTNRREFLGRSAAAFLPQAVSRPRNVLLLIADDLGLHTGAYGDTTARTPNLDVLANDGVRFTNAYCTTASCSASRSVILSGLHNHANGQYGHAHSVHNFGYLPHVQPSPALLKRAGYRTGVIGKLHVNPLSRFRWDLHSEGNARDVSDMASRGRQFIQAAGSTPWYLHVGFADPHRDRTGFANRDYAGVERNRFDPAKVPVPSFLPDNPRVREELAEYREACNRLDQGVGFFMDVLRETKQLDNTLVVFISDNGMPFPNAKTNLYEAGSRLPMIVRSPDQSRRGLVNNAMVSWTDLVPTFLDWTRAKGPNYELHGRSWLPILETESPSGWDQVFFSHTYHEITMHYPMRGTRDRRYRYLKNLFPESSFPHASDLFTSKTWQSVRDRPNALLGKRTVKDYLHRPAEELYDLRTDPDEVRNLAVSPEHGPVLRAMREQTQSFRVRTKDPWLINDEYA